MLQGRNVRADREEARSLQSKYQNTSCPICLEMPPARSASGADFNVGLTQTASNLLLFQIAIAMVREMDLPGVPQADANYSLDGDTNELVNNAAEYFARYLHNSWWDGNITHDEDRNTGYPSSATKSFSPQKKVDGVLIFLSIQDRVCFISAGRVSSIALPWWRLGQVVSSMRHNFRTGAYDEALMGAVDDIAAMLEMGPPSPSEHMHNLVQRFGGILVFAAVTFSFAILCEIKDRRRRSECAKVHSGLSGADREEARSLQSKYQNTSCPICLEIFVQEEERKKQKKICGFDCRNNNKSVEQDIRDSFGIPICGSDGLPLKILHCGHIFDESCWQSWVNSGNGDPGLCPVCRQDVAGKKCSQASRHNQRQIHGVVDENFLSQESGTATEAPMTALVDIITPLNAQAYSNYNSMEQNSESNMREGEERRRRCTWFSDPRELMSFWRN